MDAITLDDYEERGRQRLPAMARDYLGGAAADELTLRWNREAFQRIRLRPHVLVDVSTIDASVTILEVKLPAPLLLAPVAYQKLFHAGGEVAAATGAAREGAIYTASTASNSSIEEITAARAATWMQIYIQNDRDSTRDLVLRAEESGCRALCLTVDTPVLGTRTRQVRAGFALPADLKTPHLDAAGRSQLSVSNERISVTWKDVAWLASLTKMPIVLKGILDPEDAARAVDEGAAGIVVSNHGGRNLDTVPATIDALPAVIARVNGRIPVLMDGGVRRGTDVAKAMALGAAAVMIGRPFAWALAVDGADGVAHVLRILRDELETAMALLGRPTIESLRSDVIW